jgi:hypothetical protein
MAEASAAADIKAALRQKAFARPDALTPEIRARGSRAIFQGARDIVIH